MAANSKIEWTDHTINFWVGCTKISPGCDNCYAESWAKRGGHSELWKGDRRKTKTWGDLKKWNRAARETGRKDKVFVNSLSDFFDNQADPQWRADAWAAMRECESLIFILVTKRPENFKKFLPQDWGDGYPNVWLLVTAEDQERADHRIPILLATPAAVRGVSIEPMLGSVDLRNIRPDETMKYDALAGFGEHLLGMKQGGGPRLGWVICDGESGHGARPMHPDWARSLRDQCAAAGIPFFFKKHGEWIGVPDLRNLEGGSGPGFGVFDHFPYDQGHEAVRIGKSRAGRLLDGREHNEFPEARS
jgi:protein gp37